jgi:hypothetical protein
MTIVVETGSGLDPTANSYASLAAVRAYAEARGILVSEDDDALSAQMILGMDYLESYWKQYIGTQTQPAIQPLQWPRDGVCLYGVPIANNVIPRALVEALSLLVVDQTMNGNTTERIAQPFIKSEKIGPITTEYSETVGIVGLESGGPIMEMVTAKLEPLLNASAAFSLVSLRV